MFWYWGFSVTWCPTSILDFAPDLAGLKLSTASVHRTSCGIWKLFSKCSRRATNLKRYFKATSHRSGILCWNHCFNFPAPPLFTNPYCHRSTQRLLHLTVKIVLRVTEESFDDPRVLRGLCRSLWQRAKPLIQSAVACSDSHCLIHNSILVTCPSRPIQQFPRLHVQLVC